MTAGTEVTSKGDGLLCVSGLSAPEIGDLAGAAGISLHELTPQMASLEEAFMEITRDSVEYHGTSQPAPHVLVPQPLTSGK